MIKKFNLICLACLMVVPAAAATRTWDNDSGNNRYVIATNWSNDSLPGVGDAGHLAADGDLAIVNAGDAALTQNIRVGRNNGVAGAAAVLNQTGGSITANRVWVGGHTSPGNGEVNINGGTFTTDRTSTNGTGVATFRIGVGATSLGKVTLSTGILNVGERLSIGDGGSGEFIMNSGTLLVGSAISVARSTGSLGEATFLDGMITANALTVHDQSGSSSSFIDLYDATMMLLDSGDDGDYTTEVATLVADGYLLARGEDGGDGQGWDISATFDGSKTTVVTVLVPEPSTGMLCGLSAAIVLLTPWHRRET